MARSALGAGSNESLVGRFERLTLAHWTARAGSGETACLRDRRRGVRLGFVLISTQTDGSRFRMGRVKGTGQL